MQSETVTPMANMLDRLFARLPSGSTIRLGRVTRAPRVQRRVEGAERSEQLIEAAREQRFNLGIPFWNALLLEGAKTSAGVPPEVLSSALFHQDISLDAELELPVGPDLVRQVEEFAATGGGRDVLALTSIVTTADGSHRHIPMLDFSVKVDLDGAEPTVRAAVAALGQNGELVASGRSYHFFGSQLLDESGWRNFMYRAVLLAPIVDDRWVAHQLISGFASLRLSIGEKGEGPVPLGSV